MVLASEIVLVALSASSLQLVEQVECSVVAVLHQTFCGEQHTVKTALQAIILRCGWVQSWRHGRGRLLFSGRDRCHAHNSELQSIQTLVPGTLVVCSRWLHVPTTRRQHGTLREQVITGRGALTVERFIQPPLNRTFFCSRKSSLFFWVEGPTRFWRITAVICANVGNECDKDSHATCANIYVAILFDSDGY